MDQQYRPLLTELKNKFGKLELQTVDLYEVNFKSFLLLVPLKAKFVEK